METQPLLSYNKTKTLSLLFATLCIIDVFGVFPLISLPGAIIQCGRFGFPLIILLFTAQLYTANLLGKSWLMAEALCPTKMKNSERHPYAALANLTLGTRVANCVACLLDLTVFSAGIPNIIVAAQNLQILGQKMNQWMWQISYCYWILILGAIQCPFMWFGSPKDMKTISTISVMTVISTTMALVLCIISGNSDQDEWIDNDSNFDSNTNIWQHILIAYGIITFQFDIHPLLLTIQVDMKCKRDVNRAVIAGFLVTACMFGLITLLMYLKFGTHVDYNILQTLPPNAGLYVTIILVTLQLCFTAAVSSIGMYLHIEEAFNIPREFSIRRCIIRTSIVMVSLLLAEAVPRFDIVMSLIGGTLTGPFIFIFPAIFYMRLLHMHNEIIMDANSQQQLVTWDKQAIFKQKQLVDFGNSNKMAYILPGLTLIIGVILTIITTVFTLHNTIQYIQFRSPCLINVTSASEL